MKNVFLSRRLFVATIAVMSTASVASATGLPSGTTLYPAPSGPGPDGGSLLLIGGAPIPFATSTYSGTLTTSVLSNDASNPFGLNALTFTYLLSSNASSTNVIERLTTNGWSGFLTDVSFQAPATGTLPSYMDRQTSDVVGFGFLPAPLGPGTLNPGNTSALLVIHTDATLFQPSFASVIDGTVTSVASFSPAVIPEPGTMTLLATGLFMITRRRMGR